MDYDKLTKRINDMIEYESDDFLVSITLKDDISNILYDYQIMHLLNLLTAIRSERCIFDGSDTGTGKTYTSVALFSQNDLRPFIICPKIIIPLWEHICKIFKVSPLGIVNYELIKNGKMYDSEGDIIKCRYLEVIEGDKKTTYRWNLPKNAIVVFDEGHRCRNVKTQNAELLLSVKNKVKSKNDRYYEPNFKVLILSATLADNPKSFHIFGYVLGFYKNIKSGRNWINGIMREEKNCINNKNSILSKHLYPYRGSRMRIDELGNKFPKNQITVDLYKLDKDKEKEANKNLDIIRGYYVKAKKSKDFDPSKGNILKELTFKKEYIEELKLDIFSELIDDNIDNGYSIVVFLNYTNSINILLKKYKNAGVVYGKQSSEEQQHNIEKFQNNETNIIICNCKSGGESISLHDKYGKKRMSLISCPESSVELKQVLGRIYRAGSKTPVLQRIVFCKNTYEEVIYNRIKNKLKFLSKINDDDLICL